MTKRAGKVVQLVSASGGRSKAGYNATRFNATRHGVLSRHTVLPWESADEYRQLVDALVDEHRPVGPTEHHLVEEVAGIMWRKRRLELAEGATYAQGIRKATASHASTATDAVAYLDRTLKNDGIDFAAALTSTEDETTRDLRGEQRAADRAWKAFQHLGGYAGLRDGSEDAYREALAMLVPGTRDWWLEDEPTETAAALHEWLRDAVVDLKRRVVEIEHRGAIRDQTLGVSLDPDRLDRLARYEVHLDRKLERTLGMLLRLQDLRATRSPAT